MRDFGEKIISTLAWPPRGSSVISFVGVSLRMSRSCSKEFEGVIASWKVMGAGLLLMIGTTFLTVWPTRKAPNFTILFFGSATSICNHNIRLIRVPTSFQIPNSRFSQGFWSQIPGFFKFFFCAKFQVRSYKMLVIQISECVKTDAGFSLLLWHKIPCIFEVISR